MCCVIIITSLVHLVDHLEFGLHVSALVEGRFHDGLRILCIRAEGIIDVLHALELLIDERDFVRKRVPEFDDTLVQSVPTLLVLYIIRTGSVLDDLALLFNGSEEILDGFFCLVEDLVERFLLATVRVSKRCPLVSNFLNKFKDECLKVLNLE